MRILAVARFELLIARRNMWVATAVVLMGLFAGVLTLAGGAPSGALGVDPLIVATTSITTLSVYLIPLIGLLLSFDAIAGEVERGTLALNLSYPLSRAEILFGKFLAHLTVLAIAISVGLGLMAGLLVWRHGVAALTFDPMIWLFLTSLALGSAFLGMGYLVSSMVPPPERCFGRGNPYLAGLRRSLRSGIAWRAGGRWRRGFYPIGFPVDAGGKSSRCFPPSQYTRRVGRGAGVRGERRRVEFQHGSAVDIASSVAGPCPFPGVGDVSEAGDMKTVLAAATLAPFILVAGCSGDTPEADMPRPIALTEEAAGHYCQMVILEHEGPKAQLYLAGMPAPLWFSQVRDGIAYIKSPERTADIVVLYVNDMGAAPSWDQPGIDNWIDATGAFFVVGSDAIGGMGAPELVPFATEDKAAAFAERRGRRADATG